MTAKKKLFLCLDGGSDLMILPRMLQALVPTRDSFTSWEVPLGERLPDHLFLSPETILAGCGSGGLLALYLASLDPSLSSMEKIDRCTSFANCLYSELQGGLGDGLAFLSGLRSLYSSKLLRQILLNFFDEDLRISDLPVKVGILTFQVRFGLEIKVEHNFSNSGYKNRTKVLDLALQCMAAPGVAPIWKGRMTGGMYANNPSDMILCAWLKQVLNERQLEAEPSNIVSLLDRVTLLSLGRQEFKLAGSYISKLLNRSENKWGWGKWLAWPLQPMMALKTILNANVSRSNHNMQLLLGHKNCMRIAFHPDDITLLQLLEVTETTDPQTRGQQIDEVIKRWVKERECPVEISPSFEHVKAWLEQEWLPNQQKIAPPPVTSSSMMLPAFPGS